MTIQNKEKMITKKTKKENDYKCKNSKCNSLTTESICASFFSQLKNYNLMRITIWQISCHRFLCKSIERVI